MTDGLLRKFIPLIKTKKQTKTNPAEYANKISKKRLTGEHKKRLSGLYVPPAYTNLYLAKSPNNKIQMIGEDKAGRKQYIYNEKHKAGLEKRKYSDLAGLSKYIAKIEQDNIQALRRLIKTRAGPGRILNKQDLVEIMVYMLRTYHFRIGNRQYTEKYHTHGLSTLEPRHIIPSNNNLAGYTIDFIGKKNIRNTTKETQQLGIRLLDLLINHWKTLSKKQKHGNTQADRATTDPYVFQYEYTNPISGESGIGLISSDDIQAHFYDKYNGIYVTPKMFRTWYANYHLIEYIGKLDLKEKPSELSKKVKHESVEYVSKHLNNTPGICKKNYINNQLLENIIKNPRKYIRQAKELDTPKSLHSYLAKLLV